MAYQKMYTDYAKVKISIGSKEYYSEKTRIDSISITTGCYDGGAIGVGNVHTATCTILMEDMPTVVLGQELSVYFEIKGSYKCFGTFWVNSQPVSDGETMTLSCHGKLGQYGNTPFYVPGMFSKEQGFDIQTLLQYGIGDDVRFDTNADLSDFISTKILIPIKEEYFSPLLAENYAKKHGITKKEFLAGIAILFGGNVSERDGVLYFIPKTPDSAKERSVFTSDCYAEYNLSRESYGIKSISIDYMPTKYIGFFGDDPEVITQQSQCYIGNERKRKTMLASQTDALGANIAYEQIIECDWVGYSAESEGLSCTLQSDLKYRAGEYLFIGYNENLYAGNIVDIEDNDGNVISFYIGETTIEWDGGFTTQVSCNCDVEISTGTYSSSVSSTIESNSVASSAQNSQNKVSYADITLSNVKDSTISGSKFIDGTITGSKIKDSSIEGSKILEGTITGSLIKAATITGSLIVDGTIRNEHIMESAIDGSKIDFSTFENGVISGSAIDTSTFTDGQISGSAIDTSTFEDGTIKGSVIESSTLKDIPFASMDKAFVDDLTADSVFSNSIKAAVMEAGVLTAEEADLKYATITSLNAVAGKIDTLSSKAITTDNLSANVAKLGYLSADSAEIAYAKVDFSNIGSQVVKSSMIIDGAVTNEKVGNLSANKITSGTIDASKIRVTNLNADNLTVGTINGKLIGNGSVDLDKLSEEVPTKEYLDKVQNELQGQIDGAIETFTKKDIPTLNNEPASLWEDNATKKKHIGDICYVVNPTSSVDGYCYRFANLGTEASPDYSWVLIKDSDVTKALQDVIDIYGEITGIKKFDSEISSWKTDTDSELSSLKTRTSTLETDIGTKVETSTFNELKQTVAENSSSITTLSSTVSKKADSSTVTALSNTVNTVKQTADSNTSSISSLQTTVSKKADSSTVTELSNRTSTIEQDLSGFKTTVYKTYSTKKEVQSVETTAEQTAEKFEWLVKSGDSSANFTLTDRMATLIAETISLNGNVKVSGDMLVDGSITADKIDVKDLFAKDITAAGTITGARLYGTYAEITGGKIGGMDIQNGNLDAKYVATDGTYQLRFGASNDFFGLKITETMGGTEYNVAQVDRYALRWGDKAKTGAWLEAVPGGISMGAECILLQGEVVGYGNIRPETNNVGTLGTSDHYWERIYSTGATITNATLTNVNIASGLELYQPNGTPYIDFHHGAIDTETKDYTTRLIEEVSGTLKLYGKFNTTGRIYEGGSLLSNKYSVVTYGTVTISGTGAWVQETVSFGKTYESQPLISIMQTTQFASENIRFVGFTGSYSSGYSGMTFEVYTATKSFSYGIRWMAVGNVKQ